MSLDECRNASGRLRPGDENPDGARLAELGRRFEELYAEWLPLHAEAERLYRAGVAQHTSAVKAGGDGQDLDRSAAEAGQALAELDEKVEALQRKMRRIAAGIQECRIASIADLRPVTLVTLYAHAELWSRPASVLSESNTAVLCLLEGCCALLGIDRPAWRPVVPADPFRRDQAADVVDEPAQGARREPRVKAAR